MSDEGFFGPHGHGTVSTIDRPAKRTDYRKFNAELVKEGDFVPLSRKAARALGLEASAFALEVVNYGQVKCDDDDDGWIWANARFIQNGIGLDAAGQQRALECLKQLRIAEVEYREPKRRYVRLDVSRLRQVILQHQRENQ